MDATHVQFDGLGISFDLPSVAFSIGNYQIHWYGIIIAFGFALAVLYGGRMAYKWKMSLDGMTDVLIWGTILGIICARVYYVAFEWDYYSQHLSEIPAIWNGGIAIYGGIIGALIGAAIGCKIGKIDFFNLLDLGSLGLLIGQGIGRWGNFFNQEAFGTNTDLPWGMSGGRIQNYLINHQAELAAKGIEIDPMLPVHPCFLYESLWCLIGFLILHFYHKHRKFDGEIFALYIFLYGLERSVVEGLRTDSLYIGSVRASQMLAAISAAAALVYIIVMRVRLKKTPVPLYRDTEESKRLIAESEKAEQAEEDRRKAKKEQKNQLTDDQKIVSDEPEDGSEENGEK